MDIKDEPGGFPWKQFFALVFAVGILLCAGLLFTIGSFRAEQEPIIIIVAPHIPPWNAESCAKAGQWDICRSIPNGFEKNKKEKIIRI